jgi:hypothetical protein
MTFGMIAVGANRLTSPTELKQTAYSSRCRGKIGVASSATLFHSTRHQRRVLKPTLEHAISLLGRSRSCFRNADRISPQDTKQASPTESSHPLPGTLLLFSSGPLKTSWPTSKNIHDAHHSQTLLSHLHIPKPGWQIK